ncbi:hypothetical protein WICMUC_003778 [Wickerhamomyces mucosus]|uniref:Mitochondrial inner membrane i-AAA protease supercomplex subunit MGR3 n=1 Tax=Wickerhamomyces mucosus TaxID=1378264 RepID=A0A9P8PJA2_9ASCO|nr:hypothetical protein WICMUC_003778 [Wickerhamomyces mucosus]
MFRTLNRTKFGLSKATIPKPSRQVQRFASQFNRHQQYSNPRRRNWTNTLLLSFAGLSITGLGLWWIYWPHHTFSSSVAKLLRKGLWAESEKGKFDYQTALKFYLEALELAESENLDNISDELTGIQLKIGEMYERLHMNNEALMTYSEIAAAYLDALTTPGRVASHSRPHIVQKDLRVVVKIVELNSSNPHASKMLLMTHFLIAQDEVSKRSAYVSDMIKSEKFGVYEEIESGKPKIANVEDSKIALKEDEKSHIPKNREAWEPFRDELFNARDLYVAICMSTGDLAGAVRAKIATTEWMLNADCEPGEILMSQTNLGSIMYLQAEEYEVKEYYNIKAKTSQQEIDEAKSNKEKCLELSSQCYESVLKFAKSLPSNLRREGNVEESIALSTYGLGVIYLQIGKLDEAKNLLRESRLRAKGSGFNDLVVEAERELAKLTKEVEKLEKSDSHDELDRMQKLLLASENQPAIELDIQLAKNR